MQANAVEPMNIVSQLQLQLFQCLEATRIDELRLGHHALRLCYGIIARMNLHEYLIWKLSSSSSISSLSNSLTRSVLNTWDAASDRDAVQRDELLVCRGPGQMGELPQRGKDRGTLLVVFLCVALWWNIPAASGLKHIKGGKSAGYGPDNRYSRFGLAITSQRGRKAAASYSA